MEQPKSNYTLAMEVIEGKWGNGDERRERLTLAGYSYDSVQRVVNRIIGCSYYPNEVDEKVPESLPVVDDKTLVVDVDLNKYDKLLLEFK